LTACRVKGGCVVEWLRLIGFCLLTAMMVAVLRQMHPVTAGLLTAVSGLLLTGCLLPQIREHVDTALGLLAALNLDGMYYAVMLKAMGIVLVTRLAVQVCRDMDAPSVAQRAEFCGRLALLGVAVPVFTELTQMAVDVLR